MPGISPIKILGNVKFFGAGHKLAVDWKQPQGGPKDKQYTDAFKPSEHVAVPTLIPPWFTTPSTNKYHVDQCDDRGKDFKKFHDDIIDAVQFSHSMWKLQAKFKDLKINALTALGTPGCLDGPELESNIKNFPGCAAWSGNKGKWRDAVAKGVSKCFKDWQGQVTVPGLPWYPAFVAFPGPMAPPMPNVPMPLITCVSGMMTKIAAPMDLKSAMKDAFSLDEADKQFDAMADALSTVLSLAFMIWLPSQQVMLVMGKGPIPTFAPPYVPVGPVVMGDNLAIPGHLLA